MARKSGRSMSVSCFYINRHITIRSDIGRASWRALRCPGRQGSRHTTARVTFYEQLLDYDSYSYSYSCGYRTSYTRNTHTHWLHVHSGMSYEFTRALRRRAGGARRAALLCG